MGVFICGAPVGVERSCRLNAQLWVGPSMLELKSAVNQGSLQEACTVKTQAGGMQWPWHSSTAPAAARKRHPVRTLIGWGNDVERTDTWCQACAGRRRQCWASPLTGQALIYGKWCCESFSSASLSWSAAAVVKPAPKYSCCAVSVFKLHVCAVCCGFKFPERLPRQVTAISIYSVLLLRISPALRRQDSVRGGAAGRSTFLCILYIFRNQMAAGGCLVCY